jgi:hypothetical protein
MHRPASLQHLKYAELFNSFLSGKTFLYHINKYLFQYIYTCTYLSRF